MLVYLLQWYFEVPPYNKINNLSTYIYLIHIICILFSIKPICYEFMTVVSVHQIKRTHHSSLEVLETRIVQIIQQRDKVVLGL